MLYWFKSSFAGEVRVLKQNFSDALEIYWYIADSLYESRNSQKNSSDSKNSRTFRAEKREGTAFFLSSLRLFLSFTKRSHEDRGFVDQFWNQFWGPLPSPRLALFIALQIFSGNNLTKTDGKEMKKKNRDREEKKEKRERSDNNTDVVSLQIWGSLAKSFVMLGNGLCAVQSETIFCLLATRWVFEFCIDLLDHVYTSVLAVKWRWWKQKMIWINLT